MNFCLADLVHCDTTGVPSSSTSPHPLRRSINPSSILIAITDLPKTPTAETKAPIERLPTDVWWQLAKLISLKDLSNLRLVSRRVEHEIHQPYIDQRFQTVTIDALHPRNKHPIWQQEPEKMVRDGQWTKEPVTPNTCKDESYAPLTSLASFANLKTLCIGGVFHDWLDQHFAIDAVKHVVAAKRIKIKHLELVYIKLDVGELEKLIAAFGPSVQKLVLDISRGKDWLDLFRMLRTRKLHSLEIEFLAGREVLSRRPGHARRHEPSFPRCRKWVGRKHRRERYVMSDGDFVASGKKAVEAGLKRAIQWWEAEYPKP
ncbi:hypothetical protein LTR97_007456 [Elasticomyces elasticus]|uniref:F-box domain-containing protein n=1 Tax=Elasticomyces elasticus TaxID=574655 RepID=A0AAN7W998_9PEZI|nr:hypothetical protein LTR97_007456 [Elasticomyces elasticus]